MGFTHLEERSECLQIERKKIRKAIDGTGRKGGEHKGYIWELGEKSKIRRQALIKISKKKVSLTLQKYLIGTRKFYDWARCALANIAQDRRTWETDMSSVPAMVSTFQPFMHQPPSK